MLPFYKKVAYGMGRFGSSAILTLTSMTSFLVYGTVFELNWLWAGIALGMSYVVIGLTHWLTGYFSDSINTRWGRRKPFVVIGAPGLAATGFLLFIPNWFIDISDPTQYSVQVAVFLYYMVTLCAFKFFYAFLLTAFQAWLPEITDEQERPLVSSMQNTANWLSNGIAVVLAFIQSSFFNKTPPTLNALGLSVITIFSGLALFTFIPSMIFIRERPDIVIPRRDLVYETRLVLRNRNYVGWTLTVGFLSFSFSAITAQIVGYTQYVLLLDQMMEVLPPALALLISIITFLYLWIRLIRRYGKKRTMLWSLWLLTVLLPMTVLLPLLMPYISAQLLATVWFIPLAAGMAVYYIMSYIVPADIAHVDELTTHESRSGIYTGFIGVPLNMFQAAASFLLGWFMDTTKAIYGTDVVGLTWWGPLYAPFFVIAALFLRRIDIDPDFDRLKRDHTQQEDRSG